MARLDVKNPAWSERGLPPLPTRFGLSTGPTVVGNVGAPSRMLYTGVGDSMNLASRIEGLNRVYGTRVLVSDTVRAAAGSAFEWREIDRVRVKGKKDAVEIFEVLGRAGRVPDARLARAARYEDALSAYRRRDFEAAAALFEPLASGPEGDVAARRLLESCRGLMRQPPGEDWQATTRFSEK
ncbi:MAG: adenylate/guanylate cyclase domain-containing protein, partial [Myxococcota bacterium]